MNDKMFKILEYDKVIARLAEFTASSLGREKASQLKPEKEYSKVLRCLKETDDGVSYIMRRGNPPLGGMNDIRESLKRVDIGAVLNPGELLRVGSILRAAQNLKNYSSEGPEHGNDNVVADLISRLETNRRIEEKIRHAIISDEEISDHASPVLFNIRRQIKDAQNSIKDKLNEIIRSTRYQKMIQESIITMRSDRYVIPVKQEYRSEVQGIVHDASSSGATVFIEPMAVIEINNNIRQLMIKEQHEIERILYELTSDVAGILDALKSNVSIMAELDFIFAKARLSLEYKCTCPVMNNERRIVVKKGRHPLLDMKTVVPIDFWIGDSFRTLVVTGPNTGGKTVTLKMVGLFTLMAQSGLHVPANDGTQMSVFDNIFADIGDEQSIEQSLSTFSSHMTNIVNILKNADDRSLILFDELGAGTDPAEGAALAMSILEYLYQIGAVTVATTHYSELKVYAISTQGVENGCCEFDVDTLRPTYKLLIGIPGKSNAFAISKRLGLTQDILDRAREFLTQEDIKFEDMLSDIEKNRRQTEQEKMKAESFRLQAEALKKEIEEHHRRLNQQKEKILRESREDARRIVLEAKREAEELVNEMKKLQQESDNAERNRAAQEIRSRLKQRVDKLDESLTEALMPRNSYVKPPENLKPGDSVVIVNLNQKGTVLTAPDKNGEVSVQAGIMKINVHVSNLRVLDEQQAEIQKMGIGRIGVSKAATVSKEINLRGYNLDQAVESIDKYLDDASMAGLTEVILIHGKGTGALRNGIHQYLKNHNHVKTFRLGRFGEGEAGVTIVELN